MLHEVAVRPCNYIILHVRPGSPELGASLNWGYQPERGIGERRAWWGDSGAGISLADVCPIRSGCARVLDPMRDLCKRDQSHRRLCRANVRLGDNNTSG